MESYCIDSYHYSNILDVKKEKYYRRRAVTEEEKIKSEEFTKLMEDYVIKTTGEKYLSFFHHRSQEGKIKYMEDLGYVAVVNYDRDIVDVYGYGKTIEEAFRRATLDYEFFFCENYEWSHREKLNKQYSERFLNGEYKENDYHGPFFFAELALQHFRKYYGDNIPEEIINYYNNYLKEVHEGDFEYDYESNCLVKKNEKNTNNILKKIKNT